MSEYMEKHTVSRLMGAPPGYVGFEEGGQLTEKIRRRPYSVILFDEIEKAHNDIFNILLQIMEDGRLTDSYGRAVAFRNTVVLMTSNIGAQAIKHQGTLGFRERSEGEDYKEMVKRLKTEMEKEFRPEFINRLDAVVVFRALSKKDLYKIIDIEMGKVVERLRERGVELELTQEVKDFLIERGYSPEFGARPLRRQIEQLIEDPLSDEILRGTYRSPCKLVAKLAREAGEVVFVCEQPEPALGSPSG